MPRRAGPAGLRGAAAIVSVRPGLVKNANHYLSLDVMNL